MILETLYTMTMNQLFCMNIILKALLTVLPIKNSKTNFLLILLVAEVDIEKKKIWWLFVKYEI